MVIPAVFPEMSDGSGPIIENIDYVLDSGLFSLVETTYRKGEEDFIKLKNYLAQKQVRTIYLAPSAIYQQKLDLNSLDETERKKAASFLRDFISRAYSLNAEMLLICCGPDPGPEYRKQAKKQLVKSLCELLQYTRTFQKDYLLELIFENFDRDLQMRRLLGPTNETVDLIMEVKKDYGNINLIFDQSHIRQIGEDHRDSLFLARDCLGHVHLSNCLLRDRSHPQWGDGHPAFNMKGSEMGTQDIVNMFSYLFEIGYLKKGVHKKLPTISLEVKPLPDGDRHSTFKETCDTFLEAWKIFRLQKGL
jgi:sugar phosphate isomerase/epimerase